MDPFTIAAGAAIAVGGLVTNVISANSQNRLAKKQLKLGTESAYQDLMDSYYTQQENLTNLRTGLGSVRLAAEQEKANRASAFEYLDRWQAYADTSLSELATQGEQAYRQLAGSWAGQETANSETGRVGGSAALLAGDARQQVRDYVGDSMKWSTASNQGLYGQQYQQAALDLEAERQTALASIGAYGRSIGLYDQTAKDIQEAIDMQTDTNAQIQGRLNDYYGDEAHWGGKSLDDQKKDVWKDYQGGKGELGGKTEAELGELAKEEGRTGKLAKYVLEQKAEQRRQAEEAARRRHERDDDDDGNRGWRNSSHDDDDDDDGWDLLDDYEDEHGATHHQEKDRKNRTITETVTAR